MKRYKTRFFKAISKQYFGFDIKNRYLVKGRFRRLKYDYFIKVEITLL